MNTNFFKKFLMVLCVVFLYSCDKDYNTIGDGLIGDNHFDFLKYTSQVVSYNQKIGPIESSNLSVNALGIYDNTTFGTTTANFASQITLETLNPTLGINPEIDNVVLTIPYIFKSKVTDATTGNSEYVLDSIYGDANGKIKLSVYESGYTMRSVDPTNGFGAQKYFTNQNADFDNVKIGEPLNNATDAAQNAAFFFSPLEYNQKVTTDGKETVTHTPPGMRLTLNNGFFKTKILDAIASGKLASIDVFRDYFKGLYFKVEKISGTPSQLAMLDFAKGKITINYKENTSATDATKVDKAIVLNLTGASVNLLNDSDAPGYTNATASANATLGDEKLYIKGGEGSMAVIKLFNNAEELNTLRSNKWLINEANLIFHIDAATIAGSTEPNRIYLYDLNNNQSILDYKLDASAGSNAQNGKIIYSGLINKEAIAKGRGQNYKIRLTDQIRQLLKNADSTNVKLGLVVTGDINNPTSVKLRTPGVLTKAPKSAVMTPLGTVLYGNATADETKKLRLEIFYTKPNN